MARYRVALASSLLVLALAWGRPGAADVIVKGNIQYWDSIVKDWRPAKRVVVEVERDWCIDDPEVNTNDFGDYVCHLPNPTWPWSTHDIRLQVYAETSDLLEVYNVWVPLVQHVFHWPYHIISKWFDNVPKNSTLTIDLRFGKPAGETAKAPNLNVDEAPYRDEVDTAKAFMAHQEILDHYIWLKFWGWPNSAFGGITVIAPAAGKTSYYNHISNNINLVSPTYDPVTKLATWNLGTGEWVIEDQPDYSHNPPQRVLVNCPRFRMTCRHESSHGIHDFISWIAPLGLNWPADHHAELETNRWLAYTEGFAEFLALATAVPSAQQKAQAALPPGAPPPALLTHLWEPSDGTGLKLPQGDHWAMEGEVAGLLWDIFDPKGYEPLRHPATQTADGAHTLPQALVAAQRWWDNLEDPKGTQIRTIAEGSFLDCIQTIREFLGDFRTRYPQAERDLKVVAFNRDITDDFPEEHPAILAAPVKLTRWGAQVTLECVVQEIDPDDRPHVRLTLYHQPSAGPIKAVPGLENYKLNTAWTSALLGVKETVTLPAGFQPNDPLWLEVNDDMLPTFYRMAVPTKDESIIVEVMKKLPSGVWAGIPKEKTGDLASKLFTEDFEKKLSEDWALLGAARIVPVGQGQASWEGEAPAEPSQGQALAASSYSAAVWDTGPMASFTLKLRYRHGQGVADLLFSRKAPEAPQDLYHVMIRNDAMVLTRRVGQGQRQVTTAARTFQPGAWYDLAFWMEGGKFQATVDKGLVLSVSDPQPVLVDLVTLGSLAGTGFAFDDLALMPERPPGLPVVAAVLFPKDFQKLPAAAKAPTMTKEQAESLRALHASIREARKELRAYGERVEAKVRQQRDLYNLARKRGGLQVQSEPAAVIRAVRGPRLAPKAPLSATEAVDLASFRLWLAERAADKPLPQPIEAEGKPVLAEQVKGVDTLVQRHQLAIQRVPALRQKLGDALKGCPLDAAPEYLRKDTELTVQQLQKALEAIAGDAELAPTLGLHRKAIETMAR